MARAERRLPANLPGPFFVDASCIDCGTCWQFDLLHFAPTGSSAHVQRQPQGDQELQQLADPPAPGQRADRFPLLEQTLAFSRRSPGC